MTKSVPSPPPMGVAYDLPRAAILAWPRETDEARLEKLWAAADETRRCYVGDAMHLRSLVEVSNYCVRGRTSLRHPRSQPRRRALPRLRGSRRGLRA